MSHKGSDYEMRENFCIVLKKNIKILYWIDFIERSDKSAKIYELKKLQSISGSIQVLTCGHVLT